MANPTSSSPDSTEIALPLTALQLELLKLYGTDLPSDELLEVKRLLGRYFGRNAIRSADRIWDERKLTDEDMLAWLDE